MKVNKQSQEYFVELGKRMIDEAVLIFKQTHELSPDLRVCVLSLEQAISELQRHLETGNGLKWVRISFCDTMGMTHIVLNIDYIKRQIFGGESLLKYIVLRAILTKR